MPVEAKSLIMSSECAAGVDDEHVRCQELRTCGWTANERCECNCHDLSPVTLVSFGFGHAPSSDDIESIDGATIVIDVRHHFSDPHVNPTLRKLDGYDADVRGAVMATPGVEELVQAVISMIYASAPAPRPARSRSRSGASAAGTRHRDIDKPLLPRRARESA